MSKTRRTLLKGGGASIAALATLAGCLGGGGSTPTEAPDDESGGDGGDGSDGGNADTATPTPEPTATGTATATPVADRPATAVSGLRKWMPDPALLDQTPSSGYAFSAMAPSALRDFSADLGSSALSQFDQSYPIPGIGEFGAQTALYRFARSVSVLVGAFDRTDVEEGLRGFGFEAGPARRGFRVFTADSRAAAVRDGLLVTVGSVSNRDSTDKRPVVEAVVDARTGAATRYVDAVPHCDSLLEAVGNAHVLRGRTHDTGKTFETGLGEGMGYHVGADRTRVRAAALFEGDADRSGMAEWADGTDVFLDADPTVRVDAGTATATALVPTGDVTRFVSEYPGPPIERDVLDRAPGIEFSYSYEASGGGAGLLTITHEGGDTVPADALRIQGTGFADVDGADQTSAGRWQGEASGDDGTVVAGDRVAVGVASDYEIFVVWHPPDGDSSVRIGYDEGDAA
ncbi:MAG: hypothetical protein ABEJ26_06650 [Halosimplex sp.]